MLSVKPLTWEEGSSHQPGLGWLADFSSMTADQNRTLLAPMRPLGRASQARLEEHSTPKQLRSAAYSCGTTARAGCWDQVGVRGRRACLCRKWAQGDYAFGELSLPLNGVRVLVVEDDPLLAMDLEATLVGAGAVVVELCRTLDEAMLRADAGDFAVAVLDFSLGSETVSPVARRLINRAVPFVLYTGMSRHEPSLAEWRDSSIVEKPASTQALVSAVTTALRR
jgi:CheY-like chemotaxis protein